MSEPRPGQAPATPTPRPPSAQRTALPLSLTVLAPQDGSVVAVPKAEVRGIASPGAVVSVNGEVVDLDREGRFGTVVALEEGPNLIQVIASDLSGAVREEDIVVVFEG